MDDGSYQIPDVAEIESAYRAAHRALETVVSEKFSFVPEADLDAAEVFSQFRQMADEAEISLAAHLGPHIGWQSECEATFDLTIAGIDLDGGGAQSFGVKLDNSAFEGGFGGWGGSSMEVAARVYRRECGWDFAPGGGGIWLLVLAPVSGCGADEGWSYQGYLAGFVILHDRDEDGSYESLAHMWTARAWRRKGIALRLLQEAATRFNFRTIERPLTKDSAALLENYPQFNR